MDPRDLTRSAIKLSMNIYCRCIFDKYIWMEIFFLPIQLHESSETRNENALLLIIATSFACCKVSHSTVTSEEFGLPSIILIWKSSIAAIVAV